MLRRSLDFGDTRLPERFWDRVFPEPNTGCWLWGGAEDRKFIRARGTYDAYGIYRHEGRTRRAHVVIAEVVGFRIEGWDVRHLCHSRSCVNPDHLVAGSRSQNMQDAKREGTTRNQFSYATHCINSHEFTKENTYTRPTGGRACRRCRRDADRRSRATKH